MTSVQAMQQVVAAWLADADALERWAVAPRPGPTDSLTLKRSLGRVREALQALAMMQEAIRRETPGDRQAVDTALAATSARSGAIDQRLHARRGANQGSRRDTCPSGFNDTRLRRESLLRLSTWRTLKRLKEAADAAPPDPDGLFPGLLLHIARGPAEVPPGIAPALSFAASTQAPAFFNTQMRAALRRLAGVYTPARAALLALAEGPDFDGTGVAVHRWGRAWTVAVAGVYLDWLHRHCGGDIEAAMAFVWGSGCGTTRFKALSGLAALPTRERCVHLDLWTGLVHAQALAHDPARFDPGLDAERWYSVRVAMHDLGQRDERVKGERGERGKSSLRTLYRGLSVEMIYQIVFTDCVQRLLSETQPEPRKNAMTHLTATRPQSVFGSRLPTLPALAAGQQFNLPVLARWQQALAGPAPHAGGLRRQRTAPDQPLTPALTQAQKQALQAWRGRAMAPSPQARALSPALLAWQALDDGPDCIDDAGADLAMLGRGHLWAAVGMAVEWLELALVVVWQGHWTELPVVVQDSWDAGERCTRLLLPSTADNASDSALTELTPERLRAALATPGRSCWAAHQTGLGAFVLIAADLDRPAP